MTGLLVAVALGVLALAALLGRVSVPRRVFEVMLLALPLAGLAGAGLDGINVGWALAIAVAVFLGVALATVLPSPTAPTGPRWGGGILAALGGCLVAIVLAGVLVRWLIVPLASLANLSPKAVGLCVLVAAVVIALGAGARRGSITTAAVIAVVAAALVLLVGLRAGDMSLLGSPLVPVDQPAAVGVVWLLLIVVLGGLHPGLRHAREGTGTGTLLVGGAVMAVVTFAVLFGIVAFTGGSVSFPSFGLSVVAGYVSFGPPIIGAVLAVGIAIVMTVAAAVTLASGLRTLAALGEPDLLPHRWWAKGWLAAVLAGLAALVVMASDQSVTVWALLAAVVGVIGQITWRWATRDTDETGVGAEVDPVAS